MRLGIVQNVQYEYEYEYVACAYDGVEEVEQRLDVERGLGWQRRARDRLAALDFAAAELAEELLANRLLLHHVLVVLLYSRIINARERRICILTSTQAPAQIDTGDALAHGD